jgi:hypothetical protein
MSTGKLAFTYDTPTTFCYAVTFRSRKVPLSLCFHTTHAMKPYGWSGGRGGGGNRYNFAPRGRSPWYPADRRMGGPHSTAWKLCSKEKSVTLTPIPRSFNPQPRRSRLLLKKQTQNGQGHNHAVLTLFTFGWKRKPLVLRSLASSGAGSVLYLY